MLVSLVIVDVRYETKIASKVGSSIAFLENIDIVVTFANWKSQFEGPMRDCSL